jgi:hypothetical protein
MSKLLIPLVLILCALSWTVNAGQGKHKLTSEQKALRKELLEKYDANKDGKLDRQERANISKQDKERLEKAGLARKKKHESK